MDNLNFNSVVIDKVAMLPSIETLPNLSARAAFQVNSSAVFKEDVDIVPVIIDDTLSYMPWGGDNNMPFDILKLIEDDETLSTCQIFNAEVCFGSGLRYDTCLASAAVKSEVEDFFLDNDIASYYLGVCQDFKHFGFAVSVIILSRDGTKIVRLLRKEACYCRFAPAGKDGRITRLLYANWRKCIASRSDIEVIEMLDAAAPWRDLQDRLARNTTCRKFAVVSRIPTPDSTYYPIPYYASLFKGKWYNIKQLIGLAKESKLRNSAPIKYQIEISQKYWESIFRSEGITDRRKQQERIVQEKQSILGFLTGAENSGNGFGVVSNQNVAPASKERVDRLIGSLADYRDECIANLLPALVGASQWLTSSQASFFGETLFPDLAITEQVKGTGSKWERYLSLRPKILDIEASLAEEFFSPELIVRLKNEVLRRTHTADLARVINAIRGQVVDMLNGGSIRMRDMIDVVNHIRCNPDLFPEWHDSETAKLYAPPVFSNLKTNKGYWF